MWTRSEVPVAFGNSETSHDRQCQYICLFKIMFYLCVVTFDRQSLTTHQHCFVRIPTRKAYRVSKRKHFISVPILPGINSNILMIN